ncbi:MAG TPA: short-chain dehydrogenase [Cytophagales bacterium]|nr:short-chain dehydrogenase [Cytophagales bacterium]HCR53419.1 short-chain dehydrogenase [Cytophagales bacterium]
MDLNLSGKRAVVCGATQGIGRAAAEELAKLGASITLVARDEEKLRNVMTELPKVNNQKHEYLVVDFNMPDDVKLTADIYSQNNPVHILVNNTGGPPAGPAIDARSFEFVNAFQAHLICNQYLVQAFVPAMKKAKYGRIINIISTSVKAPIKGLGVSNTIRGAVANWAKTLSFELAEFGITVNNVLPGATMTGRLEAIIKGKSKSSGKSAEEVTKEMVDEIPAGRIGEPYEVAAAIAFLATPAAAYINGINVPVDGGRTGNL